MPTPNLGLATINGSDFVSASVLSQNFEILDKLGYDYVIEQGKSGQWRYRKFKSGIAEAWAKITFPATTASGQLQSGVTFPFAFSEEPCVSVCGGVNNRTDSHISYCNTHGNGTGLDCYIYKASSDNFTRWIYVHVIGMVKAS